MDVFAEIKRRLKVLAANENNEKVPVGTVSIHEAFKVLNLRGTATFPKEESRLFSLSLNGRQTITLQKFDHDLSTSLVDLDHNSEHDIL